MSTPDSTMTAGPVTGADRIAYLDILRGFAVMAIFVVNIKAMAMPFPYYMNPSAWGSDLDQHIANIQKFIIDDKWRTNFTALYGAGLMMIWSRLEAKGLGRGVLWTRNLWLMLFGAIHLFLMWIGDILFMYAVTGLLAVLFTRMSTKKLFVWGTILLILGWLWMSAFSVGTAYVPEMAEEMAPIMWNPSAPEALETIKAYQGGVIEQITYRVPEALMFVVGGLFFGGMLPVTLGLMVMGMALFRTGFLTGGLSKSKAATFAVIGLGAAWALDAYQIMQIQASGYDFTTFNMMMPLAILDGWLGALGYASLISLLVALGLSFRRVAAVGRMAFTNYISCTLIGTTLAGGHALGWYGEVTLVQLMYVVGATFVAMLIWSPLWLNYFRFGPLEWLWRSLVYGKAQPFRR